MSSFIHDNFMLKNETAVNLYHQFAKDLPIYDYHCHLSPQDIADNSNLKISLNYGYQAIITNGEQ